MQVSLVIPVYNSENILPKLVEQINKNLDLEFEIILVNDFSKDRSWEIIKKIAENKSNVKGVSLKENYGQHNAIAAGLNFCKGEYIVVMDDDLQHDPVYIKSIIDELREGYDACYVRYLKRKHVYWKRFISQINHISSSLLAGKSTRIYTSSFKGFNRKICNIINKDQNIEIFLDWIILNNAKKTQTIDVIHRERFSGKTNYDLKKLLILWSSMIMAIKNKGTTSKFFINILKFFIKYVIFKFVKKKMLKEKFLISKKTF